MTVHDIIRTALAGEFEDVERSSNVYTSYLGRR